MTSATLILGVLVVALVAATTLLRRARAEITLQRTTIASLQRRGAHLEAERAATIVALDLLSETVVVNAIEGDVSLIDPTSGLLNDQLFRVSLESRVSAARRQLRPVAIVLLQVAAGARDPDTAELTCPALVGGCVKATLRDADTACRLDDGRFALILEDTPENGAVWTVERIRRALAAERPGQTVWAGVACYPATAFEAGELFDQAGLALTAAQEWRQDRIEVATAGA